MLLCSNCHDRIDLSESVFTVEYLKEIKRKHINEFKDLVDSFTMLIGNNSKAYPNNLKRLYI